jgi:hypothetical protein
MADTETLDVDAKNLKVLQREDPLASEIVERAEHATVYSWDARAAAWSRLGVCGCLLIVARSSGISDGMTPTPRYRLVVLNRESPTNFCEPISAGLRVEACDPGPYMLYRRADDAADPQRTIGLWFLSAAERDRCVECVRALVAECAAASQPPSAAASPAPALTPPLPTVAATTTATAQQLPEAVPIRLSLPFRCVVPDTAPSLPSLSPMSIALQRHLRAANSAASVTVTREGLRDAIIRLASVGLLSLFLFLHQQTAHSA